MEITKQQAIADLTKIFNTRSWEDREDGKSFVYKADFFIDKRDCERCEVMAKLKEYLKDKTIKGGQCRVEVITLLWTVFHIEDRGKEQI